MNFTHFPYNKWGIKHFPLIFLQGFLKVPIWWYEPLIYYGHQEPIQNQVNGVTCKIGALEVSSAGSEYDHFVKGTMCKACL